MARRNIPKGLISQGFQTITATASTAAGLNSTVSPSDLLLLSVETQNVRMRSDGVDPTVTTGVLLSTGNSPYWLDNFNKTSDLKFIEVASSTKLSIHGFVYRGGVS
jgi:hypothetical protein